MPGHGTTGLVRRSVKLPCCCRCRARDDDEWDWSHQQQQVFMRLRLAPVSTSRLRRPSSADRRWRGRHGWTWEKRAVRYHAVFGVDTDVRCAHPRSEKVMGPSDDRISFVPPRRCRYLARHETRGPRATPGRRHRQGRGCGAGCCLGMGTDDDGSAPVGVWMRMDGQGIVDISHRDSGGGGAETRRRIGVVGLVCVWGVSGVVGCCLWGSVVKLFPCHMPHDPVWGGGWLIPGKG